MITSLLKTADVRQLEARAASQLAPGTLMSRAGQNAADWAIEIAGERVGHILILAGPGDNGGDALVAALALQRRGVVVKVVCARPPETYRGDARIAWQAYSSTGEVTTGPTLDLLGVSLIIDGLFGIGLNKILPEELRDWVREINLWSARTGGPILALDIPSGLLADTGRALEPTVRATHTITYLCAKPGLFTADGKDYCGVTRIASLGVTVPPEWPVGALVEPAAFAVHLIARQRNSHKGQFGSLAVVGGNRGMLGAAILAARTALHSGAGKVYVRLLDSNHFAIDPLHPEIMFRGSFADLAVDACVIGPGLGDDLDASVVLEECLNLPVSLVVDADALNILARTPRLHSLLMGRQHSCLLTPHPLEAARLLQCSTASVQDDRIKAAITLARQFNSVVALKGAGTVVADDQGRWAINPTGNPGLATGGTGDVLAGLAGALLGQKWGIWEAALGSVWLHGQAADHLVAAGCGPVGLTPSELAIAIRAELNRLIEQRARS